VHPHTLTYRLKQIRRRFGIDLGDPEVRLRVQLALHVLDARGTPVETRRPRRRRGAARAG
jgi:DNA-binding PucR family transcriptional regulator